jgi:hypothetical protein
MWDDDYDADREDARSDARAEGGGRRYRTNCGEGVCGASDCSTCRNGDDEDEVEEEDEDEVEEEAEAEVEDEVEDEEEDEIEEEADWRMCEGCGAYTPTARSRSWSDHAWCDNCTSRE